MHSRFVLNARPDRRWYLPGDTVRCEVSIEQYPLNTSTQRHAASSLTAHSNVFSSVYNDFFGESTDYVKWVLDALELRAGGYCRMDPEWFSSDLFRTSSNALQRSSISTSLSLPNHIEANPQQSLLGMVLSMIKRSNTETRLSLEYTLFESPIWTIAQSIPNNPERRLCFSFSLRLPDELPPSFEGTHAKIEYLLSITTKWRCEGNTWDDKLATLIVSIRVFCMAAMTSTIFITSIFPLRVDHPLVDENYGFECSPLIQTTTSGNNTAEPLHSTRIVEGGRSRKKPPDWYALKLERQTIKGEPRSLRRFEFTPPNSNREPVQLILHSAKVAVGSSVLGVFSHNILARADLLVAGESRLVPLLAHVSLQFLECGNEYSMWQEKKFEKAYGVDNLGIIRCHILAEERLLLLDSPNASFTFHLTVENIPGATFFTDIVSAMWHIRVQVVWGIHDNTRNAKVKSDEKTLDGRVVEAVIPIIVEPPPVPLESRYKLIV
ncbi:unnamed protein product [Phytomonas sp. EM1]|nr:unnamed protein product [Phytomonas sp. EM1]|eukprot:CCW59857.1 unnamed protein product [Phytomonas sp. isolate EM1]